MSGALPAPAGTSGNGIGMTVARAVRRAPSLGIALLLVLVLGSAATAQSGSQSEIFVPSPPKAPPPQAAPAPAPAPARRQAAPPVLSGCIRMDVQVAARDQSNLAWDPIPNRTEPPDITVYDATTRAKLFGCIDTYVCAGTVNASGSALNLLLNDDDFDAPDFIGQGSCPLSSATCTLGLAQLRLSRC